MNNNVSSSYQPVKGQKILWSLITLGGNMADGVLNTFLVGFYFFDVLGIYVGPGVEIRAALIGTAVALGKIIQGLFNLPVARYSDRIRTRWGRRRVFILIGCIPWSICIFMLFWIPDVFYDIFAQSLLISIGWLAIWFILYNMLNAFVINPYLAMLPEIAKTSEERTNYQQVRTFFQFAGTVAGALAFPIFPRALSTTVIVIMMIITALITFLGSREDETVPPATIGLRQSIEAVFKNKAFVRYIGTIMGMMAVQAILMAALPIIVEGILGVDIDSTEVIPWIGLDPGLLTAIVSGLFVVTAILIIPFIGIVQQKIGKKKSLQLYLWLFAFFSLGIAIIGLLPGTPLMGTDEYYRFILLQLLATILLIGFPAGGIAVLLYSVFSDVIDSDSLGDEQRRESMYFAVQGVLDWGAASAGAFLMGLILAIFGSSDFRIEDMGLLGTGSLGIRLLGVLSFIIMALAAYIFRKYPIEN